MITNIRNQTKNEPEAGTKKFDVTPDQFKINDGLVFDQSQPTIRGLETSGKTYDKENIPLNKPYKKKGRPLKKPKAVQPFSDIENKIEEPLEHQRKERQAERQPFKPISLEGQEQMCCPLTLNPTTFQQ